MSGAGQSWSFGFGGLEAEFDLWLGTVGTEDQGQGQGQGQGQAGAFAEAAELSPEQALVDLRIVEAMCYNAEGRLRR